MKTPYVGITGFMDSDEVRCVLDAVPINPSRLIMIGALASFKTMLGITNNWPNRYPKVDKIAGIFPDDSRVLNLIHYSTKEPDDLGEQLLMITELGGKNLNGLQLNMAWPSPDVIKSYRKAQPSKQVILQVGEHAFEMINHSPKELALRVSEYEGLDYVLLDPSGGQGMPLNPKLIREYLNALKVKNPDIGLGTAGGLCPTTLELVKPLAREFPDLSIDAEGLLRTSEDYLDPNISRIYVCKSLLMFY